MGGVGDSLEREKQPAKQPVIKGGGRAEVGKSRRPEGCSGNTEAGCSSRSRTHGESEPKVGASV